MNELRPLRPGQSTNISFSTVQRGSNSEFDKRPRGDFHSARSSENIYSRASSRARINDTMQSKYQITC